MGLGEAGTSDLRRDVGAGAGPEDQVEAAEDRRDDQCDELGAAGVLRWLGIDRRVVGQRQRRGRCQDDPAA